jgi:hypothetical protein
MHGTKIKKNKKKFRHFARNVNENTRLMVNSCVETSVVFDTLDIITTAMKQLNHVAADIN